MKTKTLPASALNTTDEEAQVHLPVNHLHVSLTQYVPGTDPSGGKCPFFHRQRANNAAQNGTSKQSAAHALGDKQNSSAKNTDDGRPLCPFSLAFIYRHRKTLLLLVLAFVSGMWANTLIMNVLKSAPS